MIQHYRGNRVQTVWKWREWRDDQVGFPRADLVQGRSLDAFMKIKYKRMQTLLHLSVETHYEETYNKHETNKKIRSHGQIQVVGQMDITCIRKKSWLSCCKLECVCDGLGNDAARSSQNMELHVFVKKDGSSLDRPDDAPWSFTILFVGVDNDEETDPDLNLKNEFEKIKQVYRESNVYHGSSLGIQGGSREGPDPKKTTDESSAKDSKHCFDGPVSRVTTFQSVSVCVTHCFYRAQRFQVSCFHFSFLGNRTGNEGLSEWAESTPQRNGIWDLVSWRAHFDG